MNRFSDINLLNRKQEDGGAEAMPRESRFRRMKNLCTSSCPSSFNGWLATLLGVVILWQLLVSWSVLPSLTFPLVNKGNWQAVFLVNGGVPFFGHLSEVNNDFVKITDIYYLQVSQQLLPSSKEPQQQISLVKFGNEIYGPSDVMNIPKSQILHWEDMQKDSPIVQAINKMKENAAQKAADTVKSE